MNEDALIQSQGRQSAVENLSNIVESATVFEEGHVLIGDLGIGLNHRSAPHSVLHVTENTLSVMRTLLAMHTSRGPIRWK